MHVLVMRSSLPLASYLVCQYQLSAQLVAPDSVFAHLEYPPSLVIHFRHLHNVFELGHVGRTCLPLYIYTPKHVLQSWHACYPMNMSVS